MGKTLACLALMPGTVCQAASQTPFALGVLNHRRLLDPVPDDDDRNFLSQPRVLVNA